MNADNGIGFSVSLGGGLICHVSDRVGVRLDVRCRFTFTQSSAAVFCSGGFAVACSGSGYGQIDVAAGLQLAFSFSLGLSLSNR